MDKEQALLDPERLRVLLVTHEKTVRYAERLLDEGELLEARSVLNAEAAQLQKTHFDGCPEDIEKSRNLLLAAIEGVKEELRLAHLKRSNSRKASADLSA